MRGRRVSLTTSPPSLSRLPLPLEHFVQRTRRNINRYVWLQIRNCLLEVSLNTLLQSILQSRWPRTSLISRKRGTPTLITKVRVYTVHECAAAVKYVLWDVLCFLWGTNWIYIYYVEVLCASVIVKSGLENRDYGRRGSAALTMALTSPTSGGRSVGIVRSRTKATELVPRLLPLL
jgi:hypothetical protein